MLHKYINKKYTKTMRLNTNNKVTFEDRHKNPITETLQSIETSSSLMECKKRSREKARREGDGRERLVYLPFLSLLYQFKRRAEVRATESTTSLHMMKDSQQKEMK